MKHIVILLLLFAISSSATASDLTLSSTITSPVSGCDLTSAETVKITVINADIAPYSGTFNISYTIGATTVTESVTVPLLPTSTTYIYEFTTDIDLSVCGIHDIQFIVSDPGDLNATNDTLNVSITNDCTAAPGSFNAPSNVCLSGNSGSIDLTGNTGIIQDWEFSTNGSTWTSLANTTSSQLYNNLAINTTYRVIYGTTYGLCPDDTLTHSIVVDDPSSSGVLSSDSTHCDTILPTSLYLNGYVGSVLDWQLSTDGGNNFNTIVSTEDTLEYTEIGTSFQFFTIVQNGSCPQDSSNIVTISFVPGSDAGIISGIDTLCVGQTSVELTVNGNNGTLNMWQTSINSGTSWIPLANPMNPMQVDNITQNTLIMAIFQEGSCPADTSTFQIEVIPSSNAGNIIGALTICDTLNAGFVYSENINGNIINWISSTDGGTNLSDINETNDTLYYSNLNITTSYGVIVQYLNCPADTSDLVNVEIFSGSNAGIINGPDSICDTENQVLLYLTGYSGNILDWESSIDSGTTWQSTFNSNDSLMIIDITQSTAYQVIVQGGSCDPDTVFHDITVVPGQGSTSQIDTLFLGESIQITALDGNSYQWSPDQFISDIQIQSPIFSPQSDLSYEVIIANDFGCTDTSFYHIIVVENPFSIIVSNLVTPNGDGKNENWIIENIEQFSSNAVVVFDAYGRLIFKSAPYLNDWNLNADQIPDGTYFYNIQLNANDTPIKGTFTVVDSK